MLTKMLEEVAGLIAKRYLKRNNLDLQKVIQSTMSMAIDAAYKMTILSQFAFGMTVKFEDVAHQGIRGKITPEDVNSCAAIRAMLSKLVGPIGGTKSGLRCRSHTDFLPKSHPLAM